MNASATLQSVSPFPPHRGKPAVTAARIPPRRISFTSPVVDYEPPPVGALPVGPCLSLRRARSAALHRHAPRPLRPVPAARPLPGEPAPPRAAAVFADTALRRILEVSDRRRPVAQLRRLVAPALFDAMVALTRTRSRDG